MAQTRLMNGKVMNQGRLLVVIDDVRISRLICNVAELCELSTLAIKKSDDITIAYRKFRPDVILLDSDRCETQGNDLLRKLAQQYTDVSIVLTSASLDHSVQMEDLCRQFGLNIVGVLPNVFNADILKHKFISIFKQVGEQLNSDAGEVSIMKNINQTNTRNMI